MASASGGRHYLAQAVLRAGILTRLRSYFSERNVLEVETPLLSQGVSHDCHIDVFGVETDRAASVRYLQTSPELHMKRLLAKDFPDIFQICKSFRLGELGQIHNPEFTLLEWYRKGFTLEAIIRETLEICALIAGPRSVKTLTYREVFQAATGLDPLSASLSAMRTHPWILEKGLDKGFFQDRADILNYLMSQLVEPGLNPGVFTVIKGYPAELSSQALPDPENPNTSLRFEVFGNGMELGNGYQELTSKKPYRVRFEAENNRRKLRGKPVLPLDERFFSDLGAGIPPCSGVALGLDRLLVIAGGHSEVNSVINFPWEVA